MDEREKNSWWRNIVWSAVIVAGVIGIIAVIGLFYFFRLIGFKWAIGLFMFFIVSYLLLVNMNEPKRNRIA